MYLSGGAHVGPLEDVHLVLIWETRARMYVCCCVTYYPNLAAEKDSKHLLSPIISLGQGSSLAEAGVGRFWLSDFVSLLSA